MRYTFLAVIILLSAFSLPLFSQVTGLAGWDIYLDPGHSRRENMGIYNYSEAECRLEIALQLRNILLTQTDIDTVWSSRYNHQVQVSLSQRTDQANAFGASWYHSLHSNAGSPSANSTLLLWGQYQNGLEKVPNGGKAMSDIIIPILTSAMRTNTIGSIGDCTFYGCTFTGPYLHVNRNSNMPSELSESGFHTSPLQNPRFMNTEWKRLEAWAFFWSFLEFHSIPRPPVGIVTGYIYDTERNIPLNGATVEIGGQQYTTDTWASLFHQYTNDPDLLHNGFYFVEGLDPDSSYEMIISAPDFESDTVTVPINRTFFTFRDINLIYALPPTVTSAVPAPGDSNVSILDDVTFTFSRRMDAASTNNSITIDPAVLYTPIWTNGNRQMRLRMDDTLAFQTEYTITIAATATDLFNHPLDGNGDGIGGDDYQMSFTTEEEDLSAPQIVATYPPANATGIENLPVINLEFDELLNEATVAANSVELIQVSTGVAVNGVLEHYMVPERSVLTFFPDAVISTGHQYRITVQPGIEDRWGNAIPAEINSNFTTGNFGYDITMIDGFESGLLTNWLAPQQSGSTTGINTNLTSRGNNSSYINLSTGSSRSMRLSYGWDTAAGAWLIREYLSTGAPRNVLFDDSYILQMYVFGDGSGNQIRFAVDDNVPGGGSLDHEVSLWTTIDWIGWRLISWDLANDPVGSWLGNGVLNGTLRFDSIQLTYVPGAATEGQIYIDDLRLVREVPLSIADETPAGVPQHYSLAQNYPNPFNPVTNVAFGISKAEWVSLIVYDLLGRKITTLVNERMAAGRHTIQWDGHDETGQRVASGTYLYWLHAGDFQATRKMLLVR